jgi:hypothetical protein
MHGQPLVSFAVSGLLVSNYSLCQPHWKGVLSSFGYIRWNWLATAHSGQTQQRTVTSRQVLPMVDLVVGRTVMLRRFLGRRLTFPQPNPPPTKVIISVFSATELSSVCQSVNSHIMKIEATRSSETSAYNKPTRRHIPGDGKQQAGVPFWNNISCTDCTTGLYCSARRRSTASV